MSSSTRESLARFVEEDSWTARAKLIERVAARHADGVQDDAEQALAEELFRLALYDGEPLVRRVLAETLKHARNLPPDIVRALAHDRVEVSLPFLAGSPLLGDDVLIELVAGGTCAHAKAVASRRPVSPRLAEAIVRCADSAALRCLLANEEAALSEQSLNAILDHVTDPSMVEAIARRRVLPVGIVGRLAAVYRRRSDAADGLTLLRPMPSAASADAATP